MSDKQPCQNCDGMGKLHGVNDCRPCNGTGAMTSQPESGEKAVEPHDLMLRAGIYALEHARDLGVKVGVSELQAIAILTERDSLRQQFAAKERELEAAREALRSSPCTCRQFGKASFPPQPGDYVETIKCGRCSYLDATLTSAEAKS